MPGPNRASQRRISSAWASPVDHSSSPSGSHVRSGAQRYWLEIHDPRGRPRTIRPSIDNWFSTQVVTFVRASYGFPAAISTDVRNRGSSQDRSAAVASPRAWSARSVEACTSDSQASTSPSTAGEIRAISFRRSRIAIPRVAAACTTAASSRGATNMVRRIPSIRTRHRSS